MIEIRHSEISDSYTTRDAYNDIFIRKGILHKDSLYLWLIKLLNPEQGKALLDIACGEGRLVTLAEQKGIRAMGTDFAINGVLKGKKGSTTSGWFVADGERLPLKDNAFDYITHIGSLEHYNDPIQGAKEISRILKYNGKACILLPNTFGLLGNVLFALRTGDIYDDGQPLQRYATRKTWEKMLNDSGLQVTRVFGYNGVVFPMTKFDWKDWLSKPVKIMKYIISALIPANLSNHIVFLCTKQEKNDATSSNH